MRERERENTTGVGMLGTELVHVKIICTLTPAEPGL